MLAMKMLKQIKWTDSSTSTTCLTNSTSRNIHINIKLLPNTMEKVKKTSTDKTEKQNTKTLIKEKHHASQSKI